MIVYLLIDMPRLDIIFYPREGQISYPIARYRAYFHGYIKAAAQQEAPELYEAYFLRRSPIPRPYTFAVLFTRPKVQGDYIYAPSLKFSYSSPNPLWIGFLLRYAQHHRHMEKPAALFELKVGQILLWRPQSVISSTLTLQTLSPLLVRAHDDPEGRRFYIPKDGMARFKTAFLFNIDQLVSYHAPHLRKFVQDLEPDFAEVKTTVVKYYKTGYLLKYAATIGRFTLQGEPALLQFLLESGIGAKRSMGFGMVEIAKQPTTYEG